MGQGADNPPRFPDNWRHSSQIWASQSDFVSKAVPRYDALCMDIQTAKGRVVICSHFYTPKYLWAGSPHLGIHLGIALCCPEMLQAPPPPEGLLFPKALCGIH